MGGRSGDWICSGLIPTPTTLAVSRRRNGKRAASRRGSGGFGTELAASIGRMTRFWMAT